MLDGAYDALDNLKPKIVLLAANTCNHLDLNAKQNVGQKGNVLKPEVKFLPKTDVLVEPTRLTEVDHFCAA